MKKGTHIRQGSLVEVRCGEAHIPHPAKVTKQHADGSIMALTKRFPTQAELERGDYSEYVKTPKRFKLEDVIQVIA